MRLAWTGELWQTRRRMKPSGLVLLAAGLSLCLAYGGDDVDLNVVHRIKAEAFNNSQVMDHLFYLTDLNERKPPIFVYSIYNP
jgi:hypothetical protein